MSEFIVLVESITGAGWMFLSALVVLSLGFLAFDRRPRTRHRSEEAARPATRRAA